MHFYTFKVLSTLTLTSSSLELRVSCPSSRLHVPTCCIRTRLEEERRVVELHRLLAQALELAGLLPMSAVAADLLDVLV